LTTTDEASYESVSYPIPTPTWPPPYTSIHLCTTPTNPYSHLHTPPYISDQLQVKPLTNSLRSSLRSLSPGINSLTPIQKTLDLYRRFIGHARSCNSRLVPSSTSFSHSLHSTCQSVKPVPAVFRAPLIIILFLCTSPSRSSFRPRIPPGLYHI
jgi:hypothetical protein